MIYWDTAIDTRRNIRERRAQRRVSALVVRMSLTSVDRALAQYRALVVRLTERKPLDLKGWGRPMTDPRTAILTRAEARQWIRSLGLDYVPRLPAANRVVYVDQPGLGLWEIRLHPSGGYTVCSSSVGARVAR
jgi:hypothetical protein